MSIDYDKQNEEAYYNKNLKVICFTIVMIVAIMFSFVYLSDVYMIERGYVYKEVVTESTIENTQKRDYKWIKENGK